MPRASRYEFRFTFLIYPSEDHPDRYIAHCLELDIVAAGATIHKAVMLLKELIEELVNAAIKDDTIDNIFRPAPAKYWQLLMRAVQYKPPPKIQERHIITPPLPIKRVDYARVKSSPVCTK